MKRVCKKCGEEKSIECFSKEKGYLDGYRRICKACRTTERRERYAADVEYRERVKQKAYEWRDKNPDKKKESDKRYVTSHKEDVRCRSRNYMKRRADTDPLFKLAKNIRTALWQALRRNKTSHTESYLGCSIEEFFEKIGPRPENHDLDHICPLSQAKDIEEVKKLWHFSNLRWLPRRVNQHEKRWFWTPEGDELCRILLGREWIYD